MICVVQRVSSAAVDVSGETVAAIEGGLLVLIAVVAGDGEADLAYVADKLRHLRIFADEAGRMNLSVADVEGDILLVSQFTLAADTRRGRRPSFSRAADSDLARRAIDGLAAELRRNDLRVETGTFGAHMQVRSSNDGPVTVIIDSESAPQREGTSS